ncbi:hypothetical protein JL721_12199 [Aureococcus anophagefferens]|nr:hypothetical protein JL721_12199 [Aureococcus anophagefferens]
MDVAAFERLVGAPAEAPRPVAALRAAAAAHAERRARGRALAAAGAGRKSLSSPPSPPRRRRRGRRRRRSADATSNAPRILDVDVDRSPSPAVRDIEIARLPSLSPPPPPLTLSDRGPRFEASRARRGALARHLPRDVVVVGVRRRRRRGPPAVVGGPLDAAHAPRAAASPRAGAAGARARRRSSTIEAPEALDTGDDGLSAEVEQPETVARWRRRDAAAPPEPSATRPPPPTADPPVAADGGPALSPPPADPPAEERSAEEARRPPSASGRSSQVRGAGGDAAERRGRRRRRGGLRLRERGARPRRARRRLPAATPSSPTAAEIVSEAPKSPEVADAEWRALKAGVVRSVVKAAEARLESVGRTRAAGPSRRAAPAGPGRPQSFSSDEARATEWRLAQGAPARAQARVRVRHAAAGPRLAPPESLSADTDATDDAASDMAPNAGCSSRRPSTTWTGSTRRGATRTRSAFDDAAGRLRAETVVHAYPAKSLPLELAETVCCFCAPDGITCRGDSLSLKAEAAEAATESGGHATVSTSVMAFGGGGEPLYAVVLSGLQRRDAHRSKKQTAVDVAAALAAASRAKASPAACVDAANAAVARFAQRHAARAAGARLGAAVAIDEQALVPGLVSATPSKRPRADEHAVEDRAPPAPPELSRRERGAATARAHAAYCRSRDAEAGQSVWDGDGAAILEWALPVLLSRLRLSHVPAPSRPYSRAHGRRMRRRVGLLGLRARAPDARAAPPPRGPVDRRAAPASRTT